jgi:hypothetical protein
MVNLFVLVMFLRMVQNSLLIFSYFVIIHWFFYYYNIIIYVFFLIKIIQKFKTICIYCEELIINNVNIFQKIMKENFVIISIIVMLNK